MTLHINSHSPAQLTQQFFNWHITFIVLSLGSSAPTSPLPDIIKTGRKTISSKNSEKCSQTTTCIRHRRSDASAQMHPLLYYYTSATINKNYAKRHDGGYNNSSTIHYRSGPWCIVVWLQEFDGMYRLKFYKSFFTICGHITSSNYVDIISSTVWLRRSICTALTFAGHY